VRWHGYVRRVPVVNIMRSELVIPAQLTGIRIERKKRAGVEIVALAIVAVVIGIGIARAVEDKVQRRIVTTRHPCRPTTTRGDLGAAPRLTTRRARQSNLVKAPGAQAAKRFLGSDVAAATYMASGNADGHF